MGFNNLPIWLKGGLIGIMIGVIWIFIGLFIVNNIQSCISTNQSVPPPACNLLIIFYIPIVFLGMLGLSDQGIITGIILTAVVYFVLGSIIGLIVDKIKSKK